VLHCAALKRRGAGLTLEQAWSLIPAGPAWIAGSPGLGHLARGPHAVPVVMQEAARRIEPVIRANRITHLTGGFVTQMGR